MGKFHQFLTELSAHHTSIFSFLDDNLSKYQWIFTKLGVYIDIMEICFRIVNGPVLSIFECYCFTWCYCFTFLLYTVFQGKKN